MACINQSTQVYSTPSYCYWEGERRRVSVGRQYLHRVVCWKDGSKSSGKGRVGMMYRMRGPISGHAMVIRKLEAVSQPLLNINYIMREVDVFFPSSCTHLNYVVFIPCCSLWQIGVQCSRRRLSRHESIEPWNIFSVMGSLCQSLGVPLLTWTLDSDVNFKAKRSFSWFDLSSDQNVLIFAYRGISEWIIPVTTQFNQFKPYPNKKALEVGIHDNNSAQLPTPSVGFDFLD
jgi:hypothetical protein